MEFTSKAEIQPSHINKRSYNKDGKVYCSCFYNVELGNNCFTGNQHLHCFYQHSQSLLYCPLLGCPVDYGRAGGTLARRLLLVREEWRWRNSRLTRPRHLASVASWHLAAGSSTRPCLSSPFPAPITLEGARAGKQVLEQQ